MLPRMGIGNSRNKINMKIIKSVLSGVVLMAACLGAGATTRLEMTSYGDGYGFPGTKLTEVFTTDDGRFNVQSIYSETADQNLMFSFITFKKFSDPEARWIDVYFSTMRLGKPLEIGVYEDAQQFPYEVAGYPGLELTDTSGAAGNIDGKFEIFDLKRDEKNKVTSFATSFEISTVFTPIGLRAVTGKVWYNSDAAIPAIPEPNLLWLAACGLLMVAGVKARRNATA